LGSAIPAEVWAAAVQHYRGGERGSWKRVWVALNDAGYQASRDQIQKHCQRLAASDPVNILADELPANVLPFPRKHDPLTHWGLCLRSWQIYGEDCHRDNPCRVCGCQNPPPEDIEGMNASPGPAANFLWPAAGPPACDHNFPTRDGYCLGCLASVSRAEETGSTPVREAKPTTHLVVPDAQVKPGVPIDHLYWAGRYIAEREPDVVVHLGDHWDFESLSSYEKPGSRYFEGKRILADIEAGNRGLEELERGMGSFKPKRKVLLRGNHEDRLSRALNEEPRLEGLVSFDNLNDKALGWEVVDYLVPIKIDGLSYAHYFYSPNSGRPYSGPVETMLKNIGGSFTMGHQQGLRWGRRELADGTAQVGLVAGSYYQHDEIYRGPQGNAAHWRGLVVCHEVRDGDYDPMMVSLNFLRKKFR